MILAALAALTIQAPLVKIGSVPLPGPPNRFDYQSISGRRLFISHMGDGKVVVFDLDSDKVVANLPGFPTVTGVLAVPEEGKFYGSATGIYRVVIGDLKSLRTIAQVPGARFPDGIAYASKERRIFVSDESGGVDLVIDGPTNRALARIDLGGEAGNTHYDPVAGRIWVAVQTHNEMVEIDPSNLKIVGRFLLAGSDHPHGFYIDDPKRLAYISCEGNNKLLVAKLDSMKVLQSFDVADGPDVLAFDAGLQRLYVACEGGAVDVFQTSDHGLRAIGSYSAPNAHTVSVDPKSHRVFIALKDVNGKPELWILRPNE